MIKRSIFNQLAGITLFIYCIINSSLLYCQSHTSELNQCEIENTTFQAGEALTYKIYYHLGPIWLPAGEVQFSLTEDEKYYYANGLGRSYKNYAKIYYVYDIYKTKISKESLLPSFFLRDVTEGKFQRYDSILFDQQSNTLKSFWGKTATDVKPFDFKLDECMHDMLSILYYVRNIDFSNFFKGENIPVQLFFDKKTYRLNIEYKGIIEDKKIKDLGRCSTIRIRPEMVAGHVFKEGSIMDIWISNDKNRIPLLIESPLVIGSVRAVLKNFEGLKYPFLLK